MPGHPLSRRVSLPVPVPVVGVRMPHRGSPAMTRLGPVRHPNLNLAAAIVIVRAGNRRDGSQDRHPAQDRQGGLGSVRLMVPRRFVPGVGRARGSRDHERDDNDDDCQEV